MSINLDKVVRIMARFKDGNEELDKEQLAGMLNAAIEGLENCDANGAANEMLIHAGYSIY